MNKPTTSEKSVPVCLLVRVSTDRQETARQMTELKNAAAARGWQIVEVCEETVTGRADLAERGGLQRVEELAAAGKVKKVLVHEISRLTRRPSVAHTFVEMLEGHGVSLYWHAQNIETLLPSGKRNPAAAIMLAVLAEMARAETDTLRERINSGLAHARLHGTRSGRPFGRPVGSKLAPPDFLAKHRDLVKLLKAGQSIRNAAKIAGKGFSTAQRVKAVLDNAGTLRGAAAP